jgi:predicted DNA-binding transcriptional regulator YafY
VDKTLRVLRAEELRDRVDEAPIDISEVPRMDSSTVVASVKYAIDHNETVHLTHAESDGSTAVLLVDPIRLGGGSLTAYDHHAEQVRTLAVSRISGVVAIQISA